MTDPGTPPDPPDDYYESLSHNFGATFGRCPPHNDSDERIVLAAALTDDAQRAQIVGLLGARHGVFYAESHRRIYQALADLVSRNLPSDIVSVSEHLRSHEVLQKIGDESKRGLAYLSGFASEPTLSADGIDAACARILASAQLRDIATECNLLASEAYRPGADLESIRARLATIRVDDISTQSAHGFDLQDATAIFQPLETVEYTIDKCARKASLVILGAYGGSYKTWLALDALLSVGSGSPWLGRFETTHGQATFIDCESGSYELRRRLQLIARGRDIGGHIAPLIDICTSPGIYMDDPEFKTKMLALGRDRALVIIDSLAAMSPGIDENTTGMRRGLDVLRNVSEKTGCTFMVLAHAKKLGSQTEEIDERETLRGSSAIYDAADAVLTISRVGHEPNMRSIVRQTKVRHGRKVDPFDLVLEDRDGGILITAVDPPTAGAHLSSKDLRARFRAAIVDIVRRTPRCSGRALYVALDELGYVGRGAGKIGRDLCRDEIALLVEEQILIKETRGGHGAGHSYTLGNAAAVDEAKSVRDDTRDGE